MFIQVELRTWRASERAWYCIRGLRPMSPNTTTQALPLFPPIIKLQTSHKSEHELRRTRGFKKIKIKSLPFAAISVRLGLWSVTEWCQGADLLLKSWRRRREIVGMSRWADWVGLGDSIWPNFVREKNKMGLPELVFQSFGPKRFALIRVASHLFSPDPSSSRELSPLLGFQICCLWLRPWTWRI